MDVVLDQWDLAPGDDVAKFRERGVSDVDRVLVVCTPTYVRKADQGTGGVGYEAMVVTGELVRNLGTSKFIPILRESGDPPLPRALATRLYVDLRGTWDECTEALTELLRTLHGKPARHKPPLGRSPFEDHQDLGVAHAPSTTEVVVRLTVHVARFRSAPKLYYFVNLANVSGRPVEVTHVWYQDSANHVRVNPPLRPLPVRLQPSQAWSTWLALDAVPQPHRSTAHNMFRIRLSDGTVLTSTRDDTIPPEGTVPGGAAGPDQA